MDERVPTFVEEAAGNPVIDLAYLRARRREILALAARHGGREVYVFGSVARGDARPDSDVDLLVAFEPGTSWIERSELREALSTLLDGRDVDVVPLRESSDPALRAALAREAVAL